MKNYLFLLLLITIISCSSDSSSRIQSTEGSLIGTWKIQSTEQGSDIVIYNNTPCLNRKIEFRTNYEFITYLYKAPSCNLITSFDNYSVSPEKIITIDDERYLIYELTSTTLKLKHLSGIIDTYSRE